MYLHQAIARTLRDHLDATTLFGVIGEGNLYLVDSYRGLPGARYVAAAHEAGAVLMANGYAQVSGKVGVATVTHGPGLTNTVTALVEAVRNRSSVVLIAGDTAADDSRNVQNIDQAAVLAGTGATLVQVTDAAQAQTQLVAACRRALDERRPVVLNLPADLQWSQVEQMRDLPPQRSAESPGVAESELNDALGLLAAARRPVLLAGSGAANPRARQAVIRLAERRGARLATTLKAKDLFRGHRADLGVCGGYASPEAVAAISKSDCVVAFGASLNDWTTERGGLFGSARVVQVDIDPTSFGRHLSVDVSLLGDSADVAAEMLALLEDAEIEPSTFIDEPPAEANGPDAKRRGTASVLDGAAAVSAIESMVPQERTLAMDAGRFLYLAVPGFSNPPLNAYVHSLNFGVIGIGLANAIGAWFAAPQRPVLHVTGDGGFMLGGLNEFHTAVREGADLIAVVLNDGSYGAEHIQLRNRELPVDVSMMAWPDLAAVATALGGHGVTVRSLTDLERVEDVVRSRVAPVLVDVRLDPDHLNTFVS